MESNGVFTESAEFLSVLCEIRQFLVGSWGRIESPGWKQYSGRKIIVHVNGEMRRVLFAGLSLRNKTDTSGISAGSQRFLPRPDLNISCCSLRSDNKTPFSRDCCTKESVFFGSYHDKEEKYFTDFKETFLFKGIFEIWLSQMIGRHPLRPFPLFVCAKRYFESLHNTNYETPFKNHNANFLVLRNFPDLATTNDRQASFETFLTVYLCKQVFRKSPKRETKTKDLKSFDTGLSLLRKIKTHHSRFKLSLSKTTVPLLGQGSAPTALYI